MVKFWWNIREKKGFNHRRSVTELRGQTKKSGSFVWGGFFRVFKWTTWRIRKRRGDYDTLPIEQIKLQYKIRCGHFFFISLILSPLNSDIFPLRLIILRTFIFIGCLSPVHTMTHWLHCMTPCIFWSKYCWIFSIGISVCHASLIILSFLKHLITHSVKIYDILSAYPYYCKIRKINHIMILLDLFQYVFMN